jgi:uncharacterized repeat protein (TIGR03803 family)
MNRIPLQGRKFLVAATVLVTLGLWIAGTVQPAQAQYSELYAFGGTDSSDVNPVGVLALGQDGNFYGTSNINTSNEFIISPSGGGEGVLATAPLGSACEWSGGFGGWYGGLVLGLDGNFYGACGEWDFDQQGIYFAGGFSQIYSFENGQANYPNPLVLGTDGNLYGTTTDGGTAGYGTVFRLTPSGMLTVLHNFTGSPGNDGANPEGPLALGSDGNFYGTTATGGTVDTDGAAGTFYRISPSGQYKLIYVFPPSTLGGIGLNPAAGVTEGLDGNYYGTTFSGGTSNQGTIFKITSAGKIAYLHYFSSTTDSAQSPMLPLTLGSDGSFYGVSISFASGGYGPESLFRITPKGVYKDLYNGFTVPYTCDADSIGCLPSSPLFQHPSGIFYGTTQQGGAYTRGTFYSFNARLKPFAMLQLPLGTVGSALGIFGTNLTTAKSVSFGGTATTAINVISDTFMTATVPPGALTGIVSVTEASGSVNSVISFHVVPSIKAFSPTSGSPGTAVTIRGTGLTQTTKVTFGGVAATFAVTSDSQLTADVPTAAVSGKIEVLTKGGTVLSPKVFTVN